MHDYTRNVYKFLKSQKYNSHFPNVLSSSMVVNTVDQALGTVRRRRRRLSVCCIYSNDQRIILATLVGFISSCRTFRVAKFSQMSEILQMGSRSFSEED